MKRKTLAKKSMVCLLASCMTFTLAPISSFRVEAADNGVSKKLNSLFDGRADNETAIRLWEGNGSNEPSDEDGVFQPWLKGGMPEEINKEPETIINDIITINDNDTTTINNNSNNNSYSNTTTTINNTTNSNNTTTTIINQDSYNTNTTTNTTTTNTNINSNNDIKTDANINSNNRTSYSTENSINNTLNLSYVGSGTWETGRNSSEWRLKKTDGSYAVSQWGFVDGYWYLFGNEGYTCSGWQQVDGIWYFFGDNAAMQTGWVNSANRWYYLMSDGRMLANTTTPDGYEVNENGEWTVNGVVQTNR